MKLTLADLEVILDTMKVSCDIEGFPCHYKKDARRKVTQTIVDEMANHSITIKVDDEP